MLSLSIRAQKHLSQLSYLSHKEQEPASLPAPAKTNPYIIVDL